VEWNGSRKPNIRCRFGTRPFHRFGGICPFPHRCSSLSPGKNVLAPLSSPLAPPTLSARSRPSFRRRTGSRRRRRVLPGHGAESYEATAASPTRRAMVAKLAGGRRRLLYQAGDGFGAGRRATAGGRRSGNKQVTAAGLRRHLRGLLLWFLQGL
jgi:hypothetical protein